MERIESGIFAGTGARSSKSTGTMLSIVVILSATRHRIAICCLDIPTQRYDALALIGRLDKYGQSQTVQKAPVVGFSRKSN